MSAPTNIEVHDALAARAMAKYELTTRPSASLFDALLGIPLTGEALADHLLPIAAATGSRHRRP